jgi:xanthine dehydrogenase molybdopterin binding subunit
MSAHESAVLHVTGEAQYIDDIDAGASLLAGLVVYSPYAHARITGIETADAAAAPGVHAVLRARDIPGKNQMGPVVEDELCLAESEVQCIGQAVVLIAAETDAQCRCAASLLRIDYERLDAVLTIEDSIRAGTRLGGQRVMHKGDPDYAIASAPHRVSGEVTTGAQEQWYLETQSALCIPGEGGGMTVHSSTQHPSETQSLVAGVLDLHRNEVTVEVRRIGGGFGGKETQANHVACWAALLAAATHRPVKIRLGRDDDMIMTGKRHRFLIRYDAGYDDDGILDGLSIELNSDAGIASDLSFAIMERAMLHVDNAYFVPNVHVEANVWKTNLPSNTAFRGFGGPQGMFAVEFILDRIARELRMDAAEIRRRNFYGVGGRDVTHYGQVVENNHLPAIFDRILASSSYAERRNAVNEFNRANEFRKRGMALTPVKFGISFTTTFLNQAGALVHVYTDGTVLVSHGGTEMGQGLHTKIRRIAALEFGIPEDRVRIDATNTSRVPNTSATAASSGSDLNGMAVKDAIDRIKARMAAGATDIFNENSGSGLTSVDDICFDDNRVYDRTHSERSMDFASAASALNKRMVSLSSTGYYSVPGIGWNKDSGTGRPFHYYSFGMAVSEVEVDVLTGAVIVLRSDIVQDVGESINEGIDIGQVRGGFVQGIGWCTMEEIRWDDEGRLLTHSPDTYKIPTIADIPREFNAELLPNAPNPGTIRRSKAVGEPPFMLAFSVWFAIKDAIAAVVDHRREPGLQLPATNEAILLAIEDIMRKADI